MKAIHVAAAVVFASLLAACGGDAVRGTGGNETLPGGSDETEPTILEPPEPPADGIWTRIFPLGEGVTPEHHPSELEATQSTCPPSETTLTKLDRWSSRAVIAGSKGLLTKSIVMPEAAEPAFGLPTTVEIAADVGVPGSWRQTIHRRKVWLEIVAQIRTIRREVAPTETSGGETRCPPEEAWGFSEFRRNCGIGYPDHHDHGGYVVLHKQFVVKRDHPLRETIAEIFHTGIGAEDETGLREEMRALADSDYASTRFDIEVRGVPRPDSSLLDGAGKITAENVLRYIDDLEERYTSALEEERYPDPAYGRVIRQGVKPYSPSQIETCGVASSRETIDCYGTFVRRLRRFEHENGRLQRTLDRVRWRLAHPHRVAWAAPRRETMAAYEAFVVDVEACAETHSERQDACSKVHYKEEEAAICDACSLPQECQPGTLLDRFDQLPSAEVVAGPPATIRHYRVGHNDRIAAGSVSESPSYGEDICVLTGVGGAFRGTDERVRLTPDPEEGHWVLETRSSRRRSEEQMSATMSCVSSRLFQIDAADETWHRATYTDETRGASDDGTDMSPGKYAHALTGLAGTMRGKSDGANIEVGPPRESATLAATSGSGRFRSWGTSWGLDFPEPRRPAISRTAQVGDPGGRTRLASADGAICYLTRVAGNFKSAREWAKVGIEDGYWYLETHAGCAKRKALGLGSECKTRRDLVAAAACYEFDQRQDD